MTHWDWVTAFTPLALLLLSMIWVEGRRVLRSGRFAPSEVKLRNWIMRDLPPLPPPSWEDPTHPAGPLVVQHIPRSGTDALGAVWRGERPSSYLTRSMCVARPRAKD